MTGLGNSIKIHQLEVLVYYMEFLACHYILPNGFLNYIKFNGILSY